MIYKPQKVIVLINDDFFVYKSLNLIENRFLKF
jgi:hypothetical protein